ELSRSNIKNGLDGKDGIDGTDGIDGKDGINGNTITVETKEDGSFDIVISDSNGTELSRSNIKNGLDGKDGISPEIIIKETEEGYVITIITPNDPNGGSMIEIKHGLTPVIKIGENNNWWVNGKDTGVSATCTCKIVPRPNPEPNLQPEPSPQPEPS
ncbi:TPA: hypothetical protein ACGO6N_002468, partial [Streptococcus suis]